MYKFWGVVSPWLELLLELLLELVLELLLELPLPSARARGRPGPALARASGSLRRSMHRAASRVKAHLLRRKAKGQRAAEACAARAAAESPALLSRLAECFGRRQRHLACEGRGLAGLRGAVAELESRAETVPERVTE